MEGNDSHPNDARDVWDTVIPDPDVPIAEYLEHEKALQEFEGKKLSRLQIMTWAQQTRARFLKLSMEERAVFLDVLTADENGSMSRMFALQAQLESKGVTDAKLGLKKIAAKAMKSGKHVDDSIQVIRRAISKNQQKEQRAKKLLTGTPESAKSLPAGRALILPGANPHE